MLPSTLTIAALYLGFGFLLSRFLRSTVRNNPLTWVVLSVLLLPVWISFQSLFLPVTHETILAESMIAIVAGIVLTFWKRLRGAPRATLLSEERVGLVFPVSALLICLAFLWALVIPKLSLIETSGAALWDDFNNVNKVLSTSFNLADPKYFYFPSADLSYYYYDFLLPGIVHRLTTLTLPAAWFLHNMIEYVAGLSLLTYVAAYAFKRLSAKFTFLLSVTFLGGGWEYFAFRLRGIAPPDHLEWWFLDLFGLPVQVSSFYTLFLWVPQHFMGALLLLLALILWRDRGNTVNRLLIPVLFAGILGFSTFVFLTGAISFAVIELVALLRERRLRSIVIPLLQAAVFVLFALRLLPVYSGRGGTLYLWPIHLHLLSPEAPATMLGYLQTAWAETVNYVLTYGEILLTETGIICLLALGYFLVRAKSPARFGRPWLTRLSLAILVVVPLVFVSFVASYGANDLFMRGIIVTQIGLALAAASLVDTGIISRPLLLGMIVLGIATQWPSFSTEFKGRSAFQISSLPPPYDYIRSSTPKDAVIFLDRGHGALYECHGVTFQGNRMCYYNTDEIGGWEGQYVKLPNDGANYHALAQALAMRQYPHRYYVSETEIRHTLLKLRSIGEVPGVPEKAYVYEILTPGEKRQQAGARGILANFLQTEDGR